MKNLKTFFFNPLEIELNFKIVKFLRFNIPLYINQWDVSIIQLYLFGLDLDLLYTYKHYNKRYESGQMIDCVYIGIWIFNYRLISKTYDIKKNQNE